LGAGLYVFEVNFGSDENLPDVGYNDSFRRQVRETSLDLDTGRLRHLTLDPFSPGHGTTAPGAWQL
jgi:hypothetical protein